MPPPQQRFPLEPAEGVCPPLIRPNPLEVEGVVASPGCCCRPRANYLQPAQQINFGYTDKLFTILECFFGYPMIFDDFLIVAAM